ncbi:MAG: MBOAT family protein [Burkholderiaceae bacterium]|nr:MAG: MBOAT family protein [Burkholderiaceae bacterium]
MLFVSVVLLLNGVLRGRARSGMLLIASYYFYASFDVRFLAVLLFLTGFNYLAGALAGRLERPLVVVLCAVAGNLAVLLYFKYLGYFVTGVHQLLLQAGLDISVEMLSTVLPAGLSFYTFQSLSYVLDIYRGKIKPTTNVIDFALFVAFFPTVLSGPISRASELLPQFQQPAYPRSADRDYGLLLVIRGLCKKIMFADVLAYSIVDPAFSHPQNYSSLTLLIALYAFSFQMYMDLSGYTDIARGVARLLGFNIRENFNRPYLAGSVSEYWTRWHMSMSSFFRDYLYISLGGSKYGNVYLNLLLTFICIGLWHGIGWNFLLYGFLHGSVVASERFFRTRNSDRASESVARSATLLRPFLTFQFVAFTRILFKSSDVRHAGEYLKNLFGFSAGDGLLTGVGLVALLISAIVVWAPKRWFDNMEQRVIRLTVVQQACLLVVIFMLLCVLYNGATGFIYYRF